MRACDAATKRSRAIGTESLKTFAKTAMAEGAVFSRKTSKRPTHVVLLRETAAATNASKNHEPTRQGNVSTQKHQPACPKTNIKSRLQQHHHHHHPPLCLNTSTPAFKMRWNSRSAAATPPAPQDPDLRPHDSTASLPPAPAPPAPAAAAAAARAALTPEEVVEVAALPGIVVPLPPLPPLISHPRGWAVWVILVDPGGGGGKRGVRRLFQTIAIGFVGCHRNIQK